MRVDVGALAEFAEGEPRIVTVHGRRLGVVVWKGAAFALANRCPHMGAPLFEGTIGPRLASGGTLGAIEADDACPVIVCPWHRWAFELRTGRAAFRAARKGDGTRAPQLRAKRYAADVVDGRVVLDVSPSRRNSATRRSDEETGITYDD